MKLVLRELLRITALVSADRVSGLGSIVTETCLEEIVLGGRHAPIIASNVGYQE
jgi:hypothetical protein